MTMTLDGTLGITATGSLTGLTTAITPAQGGTGLTAVGTSGNLLTSNGTAWTSTAPAAAGGMTLLGTLTTTSGTSQTLSALTLTNYKQLQIAVNNVSYSTGAVSTFRIAGIDITYTNFFTANLSAYGILTIDLSTGAAAGAISTGYIATGTTNTMAATATQSGAISGNLSTLTTSTTSIAFTFSGGQTFATGTIKVYGVS